MGFLVCRVARGYGIHIDDVMRLKLRRFWLLSNTLDRLMAAEDLRRLKLAGADQSGEIAQEVTQGLVAEVGIVMVEEAVRDERGLDELRNM